jgi:hypothetical protein
MEMLCFQVLMMLLIILLIQPSTYDSNKLKLNSSYSNFNYLQSKIEQTKHFAVTSSNLLDQSKTNYGTSSPYNGAFVTDDRLDVQRDEGLLVQSFQSKSKIKRYL